MRKFILSTNVLKKNNQINSTVLKISVITMIFIAIVFNVTKGQCNKYYFQNSTPWSISGNQNAMNNVFGIGNWSQVNYNVSAASIFTPATCYVMMEGSENNATAFEIFLNFNQALIENWVNNGGRLFLNYASNVDGQVNCGFGGTVITGFPFNTTFPSSNAIAVNPTHSIFQGPNLPTATSFTGNYYAHDIISGSGLTPIMYGNTPSPANSLILASKTWGNGLVLFGCITQPYFHSPNPAATNVFNNMFSFVYNYQLASLSVNSINTSVVCAGSSINVSYAHSGMTFLTGNTFNAQLSDGNGSFANPVNIGSVTSLLSGTISCTIPSGTTSGNGYRIRVVSSNPVITGTDNGTNIQINTPTTSTHTVTVCNQYTWNGVNYDSSGVYTQTGLINAAGCDSTATLLLTINRSTSSVQDVTSCNSFSWNGLEYQTSGTYTKTGFKNLAGCDSTANLNLTINQPTSSIQNVTSCNNYTWNGMLLDTSGTYTKTGLRNAVGCDSTAILNLIISQSNTGDTLVVCNSFTWYGTTYTSTGTATHVFTNAAGCDSVVTLHFVQTNKVPAKPTLISGSANACPTDVFTYSVPLDNNVGYYHWTSPMGATILSGQGTNTVTVGFNAGFTIPGPLTVYASNCLGVSPVRSATIYLGAKPATPSPIVGPDDACPFMFAGTYALYKINKVAGATSYNWLLSDTVNSQIISHAGIGENDTAIYVSFGDFFNAEMISVTASSKCGTSNIARVFGVYGRLPVTPTVTGNSAPCPNSIETYEASVTSANIYTWTVGSSVGTILSGQGTRFLTVQFKPGFTNATISVAASSVCGLSYPGKLIVTKPGFCRAEVASRGLSTTIKSNVTFEMNIYPNPSKGDFTIAVKGNNNLDAAHIDIFNELGQTVYTYTDKSKKGTINMKINNNFSNGVYMVKCSAGGEVIVRRLVINR